MVASVSTRKSFMLGTTPPTLSQNVLGPPKKWSVPATRQPVFTTNIDWTNPLARDLVDWQSPGQGQLTVSGSTTLPMTVHGRGYKGDGSSGYFYKNSAPSKLAGTTNYTILALVIGTTGIDSRVYSFGSSSNSNPILTIGAGASSSTKLRLWYRDQIGNNSSADSIRNAFEANIPHVAILRISGTTVDAFIDGRFDSTAIASGNTGVGTVDRTAVGCLLRSTAASHNSSIMVLGYTWARALSNDEILKVSDNPWQLFKNPSRQVWVPV